jgi:hypothetical protein
MLTHFHSSKSSIGPLGGKQDTMIRAWATLRTWKINRGFLETLRYLPEQELINSMDPVVKGEYVSSRPARTSQMMWILVSSHQSSIFYTTQNFALVGSTFTSTNITRLRHWFTFQSVYLIMKQYGRTVWIQVVGSILAYTLPVYCSLLCLPELPFIPSEGSYEVL